MKKRKNFHLQTNHLLIIMTLFCFSMFAATLTSRVSPEPLKTAVSYVMVPFENGIHVIGTILGDAGSVFTDKNKILEENAALQSKVDELTTENNELIQNQSELSRLQSLYNIDQEYSQYEKVCASVISRDSGNWYNTFVINKGSDDGLTVNMNVISGAGLVGIVTEVGAKWATVRSFIDDSSNISGMTITTSDTCIVSGNLELMDSGKVAFKQLYDEKNTIQTGEQIVTSNISDKYLQGILIGSVSDIAYDANNLTKSGMLIPAVDFRHLQEVLVITTLKDTQGDTSEK